MATLRTILTQPFVVDQSSLERMTGASIDWENVGAGFVDAETGKKVIPAGTVVQQDSAQNWTPNGSDIALVAGAMAGVIESSAYEDDPTTASENYGVLIGGVLYENLLPDYEAGRTTMTGSLQGFRGFQLVSYTDSRSA